MLISDNPSRGNGKAGKRGEGGAGKRQDWVNFAIDGRINIFMGIRVAYFK
jgi:ribosomal protein L15